MRNQLPLTALVVLFFLSLFMGSCNSAKSAWSAVKSKAESVESRVEDKTAPPQPEASQQASLFSVSKEQLEHLRIVSVKQESWQLSIETTGTVDLNNDRTAQAITQVSGPISRLVVDVGSIVKEGDPLLYVSSPDLVNAISVYRKARNQEDAKKRVADRQKELMDHGAIAVKDYESAVADYNDSVTDVETAVQALRIFGITEQEIAQADQQGKSISKEMAVRAPIAGTIVQKLVTPGQLIQAGTTPCFMISELSTVWVQGHIFDRDLTNIHVGDPVKETNPDLHMSFKGTVSYIGAFTDPATRTTPVRIVTQNPGGLLKKDMFVNASIEPDIRKTVLMLPVSAVLRDAQNEPIVYVESETGKFAQRSVMIGEQRRDNVEIVSGLHMGEKVVGDGSLFLQFANNSQ
jgi:cobalt-zinc-cadmium efflux system membrane fusion protein